MTITNSRRIQNKLLLNASFIENLGLMHGKMGIAISFFQLARKTKNDTYDEIAEELIAEIYEEISHNTPHCFENGLAGIGWGIEYLVRNKYIEADTNEVLSDFDKLLTHHLIHHCPEGINLQNGLIGLGAYYLMRTKNVSKGNDKIIALTNKQTLIYLLDLLDQKLQAGEETNLLRKLVNLDGGQRIGFDIALEYPIILWFLSEYYEQGIFEKKTSKIILRLLAPLRREINTPNTQCKKLLLALSVIKLQKSSWGHSAIGKEVRNSLSTITQRLLNDIDSKTIKKELNQNNTSIRYGISGIIWTYQQLFVFNKNPKYRTEIQYWTSQRAKLNNSSQIFFGFDFTSDKNTFGIFEGIAGNILI